MKRRKKQRRSSPQELTREQLKESFREALPELLEIFRDMGGIAVRELAPGAGLASGPSQGWLMIAPPGSLALFGGKETHPAVILDDLAEAFPDLVAPHVQDLVRPDAPLQLTLMPGSAPQLPESRFMRMVLRVHVDQRRAGTVHA